jgi:hypothetical protein
MKESEGGGIRKWTHTHGRNLFDFSTSKFMKADVQKLVWNVNKMMGSNSRKMPHANIESNVAGEISETTSETIFEHNLQSTASCSASSNHKKRAVPPPPDALQARSSSKGGKNKVVVEPSSNKMDVDDNDDNDDNDDVSDTDTRAVDPKKIKLSQENSTKIVEFVGSQVRQFVAGNDKRITILFRDRGEGSTVSIDVPSYESFQIVVSDPPIKTTKTNNALRIAN